MAKVIYKSYNQNDNLLFPPCLGDFIADNDPVRVLNTVVDNLDISEIEARLKHTDIHPRNSSSPRWKASSASAIGAIAKVAKLERTDMGCRAF